MEQAITTREGGVAKRTYVLLVVNLVGVAGCVLVAIMLILWALCIIFPEPNTAPIILEYIDRYKIEDPKGANREQLFNLATEDS